MLVEILLPLIKVSRPLLSITSLFAEFNDAVSMIWVMFFFAAGVSMLGELVSGA